MLPTDWSLVIQTTAHNKSKCRCDEMGQNTHDKSSQPSEILSTWIRSHSNPGHDPWVQDEWEDSSPVSEDRVYSDPTYGKEEEEGCQVQGRRDGEGRLYGSVSLLWKNGDSFNGTYVQGGRSGWGIVSSPEKEIQSITGKWKDGELVGKGRMVSSIYKCLKTDINLRKWLNVGTVPTFNEYNVGTLVV